MQNMEQNKENGKKFTRMAQTDMPRASLREAIAIAEALRDDFAGKDATSIDLAQSLKRSPSSSSWRFLTGAAVAYGLTTGGYNAGTISLTTLGESIVSPTEEGADKENLVQAALAPAIPKAFYQKYDRNKFPSGQIAKNVLRQLGVPHDRTDEALKIVSENANFTGILKEVNGSQYIQLRSGGNSRSVPNEDIPDTTSHSSAQAMLQDEETQPSKVIALNDENIVKKPKPIFIVYGKDKGPLNQLKAILDQFKIPYRVAQDEPHSGRPISQKVRDLMSECGSAIIIFSAGGEVKDPEKGAIANLNVVFELGAASVLYGEKIIIFKENGLTLSSDFSDLGHITFDKNHLDARALELLKELISMGFVQVLPAS